MEISNRAQKMPSLPIRKLAKYADACKRQGIHVYHLNIGQPDIKTPQVALDAEKFCIWCLTDFSYEGQTVMMAPGCDFYTDPNDGRDEVRMAYVLNKEDLAKALVVVPRLTIIFE